MISNEARHIKLFCILFILILVIDVMGLIRVKQMQDDAMAEAGIALMKNEVVKDYGEINIIEAVNYIKDKTEIAGSLRIEEIHKVNRVENNITAKISEEFNQEFEDIQNIRISYEVNRKGNLEGRKEDKIEESKESKEDVSIKGNKMISEQKSFYYENLTEHEKHLLEVVVQHEVGNLSSKYKELIAELLYNRLISDDFPDDVEDMLYQDGAFQGIDYWYSEDFEIDNETKKAVEKVFMECKPSHEAIAYYNPELSSREGIEWFENSGDVEFLFEYEETSWGITYKTRFFK